MALYTPQKVLANYLERISYQAGLLGGICALVAFLIIGVNISTKDRIVEELRNDQLAMLSQVLPAKLYNNDLLSDAREIPELAAITGSTTLYTAKKDGQIVGYAFGLAEEGYSGVINMMIGIDESGTILGVRVISHTETPGLGDRIEINRDDWILGFDGLSLSNTDRASWAVKKDGGQFDQFTGATITPRAVVKGILAGLDFYSDNKGLFKPPVASNQSEHQAQQETLPHSEGVASQ